MNRLKLPTDLGRIPHSMSSGYKRTRGDDWKTWLLVYSLCCLKGIITNSYYNMWTTFVLACKLITKRQIEVNNFEKAHDLFILYANKFVELFGKEKCTFNMHLHLHIKEFILNFGQIYAGLSAPELFEQWYLIRAKLDNGAVSCVYAFLPGKERIITWSFSLRYNMKSSLQCPSHCVWTAH